MRTAASPFASRLLLPAAFVLLAFAASAGAADYYVSPSGNDGNSGAPTAPWRTLQKAANTAQAGDVVHVADGTYVGMNITRSGTVSAPITFRAQGTGALVNARNASTDDNINIEGGSYIIIDGFVVEDAPRAGIRIVNGNGVIIRNNVVARSGHTGILTGWTPGIQIIDNVSSGAAAQHGIYVSNSRVAPDDVVVRGNECFGNGQNGIQLNGDCWEGGDGVFTNALIENNVIHDNNWKGFSLISVQNSVIRNNLIYDNGISAGAGGIHLVDQPNCSLPSNDNVVVNNTIVEPRIAGVRISLGSVRNVIFNNAVVGSGTDYTIVDEVGGNFIDAVSNVVRTSSSGLFVDAAGKDFHLAPSSAAVDAGVSSYQGQNAPAVDREGAARPAGSAWDAGADELGSGGTPDATPPTVSITSPPSNATVSGTVTVAAAASDNIGVAGVRFRVDGTPVGAEDVLSPYALAIATAGLGNGAHTLSAVARDAAGNSATSPPVPVTVDNAPPPPGMLPNHPRLVLNPSRLAELRAAACVDDQGNTIPSCTPTRQWTELRNFVELCYSSPSSCYIIQPWAYALYYMMTKNIAYANRAISLVDGDIADGFSQERSNFYLHADDHIQSAAFAFDWLYDLLTPQQRATYIDYMNRLVQELYVRDPHNNPFYEADRWATNDAGNNYYYAQMLCATLTGIATYGENDFTVPLNGSDLPLELYFKTENRTHNDILDFVYDKLENEAQARYISIRGSGGGWHEGTQYGTAAKNQIFDLYLYVRDAGGTDYFTTTSFPRTSAYFHLYLVQPGDRVRYNGGDAGRDKSELISPYERDTAIQLARGLVGSIESEYAQYWANNVRPTMGSGWQHMYGVDFLWTNLAQPERDFKELPTSYFADGLGWLSSRSSWADDAVCVTFISADRVQNHQHKDQNSFTIFKGDGLEGWLAIDANFCSESNGLTKGGQVHNIIMVNGQDQRYGDGTGEAIKHEITDQYAYVMGDATDAYWVNPGGYGHGSEPYLDNYLRELVHVFPGYVVVYDRVTPLTKFENVTITYQLITQNEPTISGNIATAVSGPNKLVQKTLLPASAFTTRTANSVGCRRFELERNTPAPNTQFLNVLWAGPTSGTLPQTDLVTSTTNNMVGAHIKETNNNIVLMFSSEPTGTVAPGNVLFELSTTENTTNYLYGLLPETEYRIDVACTEGKQVIAVSPGRGTLTSAEGTLTFGAIYEPSPAPRVVSAR